MEPQRNTDHSTDITACMITLAMAAVIIVITPTILACIAAHILPTMP
jgi:hypothetical protein